MICSLVTSRGFPGVQASAIAEAASRQAKLIGKDVVIVDTAGRLAVDELMMNEIAAIKKAIHRRSAVEPAIGHMKNDGRLRRNWLKGSLGDALHAVLCGAGHNLRMILRALRLYFTFLLVGPWGSNLRCRPRNQNSYRLFSA